MDAVAVRPGPPLSGSIKISGATKNSGLKQLAAALLAPGTTVVRNLPPVADLEVSQWKPVMLPTVWRKLLIRVC